MLQLTIILVFFAACSGNILASFNDIPVNIHKYELIPALIEISSTKDELLELIKNYRLLCKKTKNILDNCLDDTSFNKLLVGKVSKQLDICYQPYAARLVAKIVGSQFYSLWASQFPWEPRKNYEDDISFIKKTKLYAHHNPTFAYKNDQTPRLLKSGVDLYQAAYPLYDNSYRIIDMMLHYEIYYNNLSNTELLIKNGAKQ